MLRKKLFECNSHLINHESCLMHIMLLEWGRQAATTTMAMATIVATTTTIIAKSSQKQKCQQQQTLLLRAVSHRSDSERVPPAKHSHIATGLLRGGDLAESAEHKSGMKRKRSSAAWQPPRGTSRVVSIMFSAKIFYLPLLPQIPAEASFCAFFLTWTMLSNAAFVWSACGCIL